MGKASRWFRNLLGLKQPNPSPNPNPKHNPKPPKEKRRWSFVKSYREKSPASNPNPNPNPKAVCQSHQPCYTNYNADTSSSSYVDGGEDANKHAIAVAAATAAVAEAAVAAAQAAAAVVRLTNSGRCDDTDNGNSNFDNNHNNNNNCVTQAHVNRGEKELSVAAVVIQSHFRGYLARRALRALKGLVKLQALVRGHIMRRKTSETMRCMQAMVRAQARARLVRAHIPESPFSSTKSCPIILHPGPPTPEKFEQFAHAEIMKHDQLPKIKRNSSRSSSRINAMNQQEVPNFGSSWSDPRNTMWDPKDTSSTTRTCHTDDDRADRILEIDTGKPHHQTTFRRRSLFEPDQMSHSRTTSKDSATHHIIPSPPSCEVVQTLKNLVLPQEMIDDGNSYCTAENSPQYCSAASQGGSSSRRVGPFTPTKSDGSRSFLSGYSDCPSYMSYTESSKAKMRSASAPKQRPQYERTTSNKRYSIHGFGEHHPRSNAQRSAAMHASFTSKAYPGSGRLDRLGMPVRDSTVVYYSGYLN